MANIEASKYAHSPIHQAVATKDYASLKNILAKLPHFSDPSEIKTESASLLEEKKADSISSVIDRRDVPNRDTALHLAVKLSDESSAEMLMVAGADWSLQNEQGWSPLQEAICNREEKIAKIIVKHYQPLAWAKWCRRLPRLIATMNRMRDFYMEITFHFDSSVIPFISRIAPSDTYKIWKKGANLRADMTLAGFDGFKIQRSDQSIIFLGDGSEDGKVPRGSLCVISHKDKEIMNALDGAGAPASEAEVQQEVSEMSKTNIIRPGIDVTEAVLLPQMTWRRQEKAEMVGSWRAKVYDMHNVVVSIKSRKVPGAMSDEEFLSSCNENDTESEDQLDGILTEEEKKQLESALKLDSSETSNGRGDEVIAHRHSCFEPLDIPIEDIDNCTVGETRQEKKGWFSGWRKRETKGEGDKRVVPPRSSLHTEEKVGNLLEHSPSERESRRNGRDLNVSTSSNSESGKRESEYKKGLRPVLWLSQDFPLRTEELLPLLDILANKVKAIRRLRDLLTTKLPVGTFPVKVAIPLVPTIRVLVTFTKFEELQQTDEFATPPSSPCSTDQDTSAPGPSSSSSWFQWIKAPYQKSQLPLSSSSSRIENIQDPFAIPQDYTWITAEEKKKKMMDKSKLKKGKNQSR